MAIRKTPSGWEAQRADGQWAPVRFETLDHRGQTPLRGLEDPATRLGKAARAVGEFGEQALGDLGYKF